MKSHSLLILPYFVLTLGWLAGHSVVSAQGVLPECNSHQIQTCVSQKCYGYSVPGYTQYCYPCVNECIENLYGYTCSVPYGVSCSSSSQEQLTKKQQKKT